jgi:chromatin structure-remodeling complex subunit RSC1/2
LPIQKNVKRRVYKNLDQFVEHLDLMFNNAKTFNEDDSQLHKDATMLQEELHKATTIEKAKSDEEVTGTGEEGIAHGKTKRIALDYIEHNGEKYEIGKSHILFRGCLFSRSLIMLS